MLMMFMLVVLITHPLYMGGYLFIVCFLSLVMLALYCKWNLHFSMVLINLEFYTLLFLLMVFYGIFSTMINISLVMVLVTTLVVEACVGLAMLVSIVRQKSNESLVSGLT